MVVLLQLSTKKYPKLKEVDDVLGGSAAWENVDSTAGQYRNMALHKNNSDCWLKVQISVLYILKDKHCIHVFIHCYRDMSKVSP